MKNCVDYVAHTCAVPEGRAATENVGDRQEWFKTDFFLVFFVSSLSLSLSFLLLLLLLASSFLFSFLRFGGSSSLFSLYLTHSSYLLAFVFTTFTSPSFHLPLGQGGTGRRRKKKEEGAKGRGNAKRERERERKRCARGGEHAATEDGRGRPTGHRAYPHNSLNTRSIFFL